MGTEINNKKLAIPMKLQDKQKQNKWKEMYPHKQGENKMCAHV